MLRGSLGGGFVCGFQPSATQLQECPNEVTAVAVVGVCLISKCGPCLMCSTSKPGSCCEWPNDLIGKSVCAFSNGTRPLSPFGMSVLPEETNQLTLFPLRPDQSQIRITHI